MSSGKNTEEADAKKYAVNRYLSYQMTDDKLVQFQSHQLQKIAHEIISEGMNLNERFQVVVITYKLLPSQKDFKNTLGHETKEFSLESLLSRLRIEEEGRKQGQRDEVLIISNNSAKRSVILKPKAKNLKNQKYKTKFTTRILKEQPILAL